MTVKLTSVAPVFILLLTSCFGLLPAAFAVEVEGLYLAELPVQTQQPAERKGKAKQGLKDVIVRVTGNPQSVSNSLVRAALAQPDQFLQQFSYVTRRAQSDAESTYIKFDFDQALINRLLRQAKLPIWGANRPNILIWLAQEDADGRRILTADDDAILKQHIEQSAAKRGLPVLFPLMDLEDEIALPVTDVWGLFRGSIEQASRRYAPEGVMAGRIYQTAAGDWIGRWLFLFRGQVLSFNAEASSLQDYPLAALDKVTGFLAQHYAVDTRVASRSQLRLWVTGVSSLRDYARVTEYLNKFAIVNRARVSRVVGDRLLLSLATDGDVQKLSEAIALDNKLLPDALSGEQDAAGEPVFRWQPEVP